MAKVLVTGATGFIGQHVTKHFVQNGHHVSCLVRETSKVSSLKQMPVRRICTGLTDVDLLSRAVQGHDTVVHLAGQTKSLSRKRLFEVNEQGTRNLAAACAKQTTPPVLIHMSSLAAAGPSNGQVPRMESDPLNPVSNYGKSKLAGEKAIAEFADQVPSSILRPGIVLGEGDKDGFEIFKGCAFGVIVVPSLSDRIFSLIHVRDLANAIELVMRSGERVNSTNSTGTYFASSKEEWTFAELGDRIGKLLGKKRVRPIYNPNFAIWAAGAIYELVSQIRQQTYIMSLDKAREATAGAWHSDGSKLFDLGFNPVPMVERLEDTIEWYMDNGWLKRKSVVNKPHSQMMLGQIQKAKMR